MFRGKCFHLISFWAPVPVTTYDFIKICKYICFGSIDHLPSHRLYVWVINYLIHIFSFEFYSGSSWWTNPCFKIWTSLIFTIHISPKLPRFSVFTHHYDTRYMRIWVYVITISHEEIFLYMLNVDKHFIFSKKAHYQKINKQTKSFSKKKKWYKICVRCDCDLQFRIRFCRWYTADSVLAQRWNPHLQYCCYSCILSTRRKLSARKQRHVRKWYSIP